MASARTKNADNLPQLIMTIGAMTGHMGKPGHMTGSTMHATSGNGGYALVKAGNDGLPGIPNPVDDTINANEIWDAVLNGKYNFTGSGSFVSAKQYSKGEKRDIDIHVIYNAAGANLQTSDGASKGIEAHRKVDFVVAHGQFLTANAKYADIVLPVTTEWEKVGGFLGGALIHSGNREMIAWVVILSGSVISHLFGVEGTIHLREGEKKNRIHIRSNHGQRMDPLPFEIELERFTLTRYPGSTSPSSYESNLLVYVDDGEVHRECVFMNNVLDVKGYRFFQASFDPDERGTILSVNKDVAGRNVTYAGYLLLMVGFIGCVVRRNSRLRRLIGQLKNHTTVFLFLPCMLPVSVWSMPDQAAMKKAVLQIHIPDEHPRAI